MSRDENQNSAEKTVSDQEDQLGSYDFYTALFKFMEEKQESDLKRVKWEFAKIEQRANISI